MEYTLKYFKYPKSFNAINEHFGLGSKSNVVDIVFQGNKELKTLDDFFKTKDIYIYVTENYAVRVCYFNNKQPSEKLILDCPSLEEAWICGYNEAFKILEQQPTMELEYQLAHLIGTAQTDEQWKNAMSAFEVTSFRLNPDEKERIYKLLFERNEAIHKQSLAHLDLAFAIRKDFGIQNNIIKPIESDGTPVIEDFTDEAITAENVAKVASTLILK